VSEERAKEEIARFACEFMADGSLYILGAGTTTHKIAELLGLGEEKTLLGVDAVKNRAGSGRREDAAWRGCREEPGVSR